MTGSQELILTKAADAFQRGDYEQAREYYKQASTRFGEGLFAESIALCDRRLSRGAPNDDATPEPVHPDESHATPGGSRIAEQLQETQALLEKYYSRCQELEYQLLDCQEARKTA